MTTIEDLIDNHYEAMFQWFCDEGEDDFNLTIEIQLVNEGKTIRRSWSDRNKMIKERDE